MVPDALEAAGFRVERHAKHFAHNAADPDWLPVVGQHPDWIALTHDARQRYNPEDRDAVMRSGVALFIHVGHMKHDELATSFVKQADRIIRFRMNHGKPFIAKVYRPVEKSRYRTTAGEIRMALTHEQWIRGLAKR
ncbi:MAG: hypothetical protein LH624_04235 [Cryobacterium sp.]|nr:hypothetical protein [Cryobacterium sp.]